MSIGGDYAPSKRLIDALIRTRDCHCALWGAYGSCHSPRFALGRLVYRYVAFGSWFVKREGVRAVHSQMGMGQTRISDRPRSTPPPRPEPEAPRLSAVGDARRRATVRAAPPPPTRPPTAPLRPVSPGAAPGASRARLHPLDLVVHLSVQLAEAIEVVL